MVRCCRWMFSQSYSSALDEETEGRPFAGTGPPPRGNVAASTIGHRMIGSEDISKEERQRRRELAAAGAQQRQEADMSRGVKDPGRVKQMQEQNKREELMGKISEYYAKLQKEVPMGLRLADLSLLRKHLEELQSES
eukprot:CAMPEP_0171061990 /NCGR_PEP_ID=MMETSP0766_2-20121228/4795_1 /TAXON_ID=439317 /ORGANISM="Gambierdiscus australes, Strain CAWD 149" /LENGTH=136 /DNA_ID=CAMNT_0011517745 /DNA_START=63 /DNA_END=470 /DNA_ORIENTATION=+